MAAVVLPTPAGPYMNSLRRLLTASGFLARNMCGSCGERSPPSCRRSRRLSGGVVSTGQTTGTAIRYLLGNYSVDSGGCQRKNPKSLNILNRLGIRNKGPSMVRRAALAGSLHARVYGAPLASHEAPKSLHCTIVQSTIRQ